MPRSGDEDPAYPERYPHRYVECRCPCCRKCWFDRKYGQCIYGGPFSGYVRSDGTPVDNESGS